MYLNNAYHFYSPGTGPGGPDVVLHLLRAQRRRKPQLALGQGPRFRRRKDTQSGRTDAGSGPTPSTRAAFRWPRASTFPSSKTTPGFPWRSGSSGASKQRRPLVSRHARTSRSSFSTGRTARSPSRWIEAYARHVVRNYRHKEKPELAVRSVKVYRVIHQIANAKEIAEGWDPYDPMTYAPYYEGEYEPDGSPKNPLADPPRRSEVSATLGMAHHGRPGQAPPILALGSIRSSDWCGLSGPSEQQSAGKVLRRRAASLWSDHVRCETRGHSASPWTGKNAALNYDDLRKARVNTSSRDEGILP